MTKITAPAEGFNGTIGDVVFVDSVAETDNHAVISYCRDLGYKVEDDAASDGLGDLTVTKLKKVAKVEGINLDGATKHDDIVAVIELEREVRAKDAADDEAAEKDAADDEAVAKAEADAATAAGQA